KTYVSGEVQVHAVRGVTLSIQPGEFVAIMGASGSGKSTMMNTLGCLDRPTSGRFLLDGVDVIELNRDELADLRNHKIGFVFQGFNLLSRTSIEIMGIFQRLNDQGMTVAMVTHELDIARYCRRVVVMRDGLVRSDEPTRDRLVASEELARLDAEQKAVQLA